MALCSVLLFSSTSNADVVTVPIGNGLTVSVMTGSNVPALRNINTNPAATQVNLGDDGNASVPLQFQYSYFGQTFNTSWMHSNGVVSFQSPNVTGNFCCSGSDLTTTTASRYNYAIMPLWTDLYGRTGRNTYYLSTPDSMTYGWYGTSQYGNSNNKSSFEVSLNASGALDMRWSGAVVNATTTMGFTGDLSRGQYYQYYYGNRVSVNGLDVSYTGIAPPPPPPPTPSPVVVPTQTATVVPRTTTTAVAPAAETTSTSSVSVSVGGVEMTTTGTISAPDNIPQTVRDAVASAPSSSAPTTTTTTSTESSTTTVAGAKTETKAGAPMSLIMSTISKIQEADKATQKAAVQNAAQQVSLSVSKSQDQAASVVNSLNAMSAASSQESSQTTQQQSSQQVVNMFGPQTMLNGVNQSNSQNLQTTSSAGSLASFTLPSQGRTVQTYTAPSAQSMGVSYSLFTPPVAIQAPQPTYAPPVTMAVDVPVLQTNTINSRTNPLAEMMEAKNFFSTNQVEQKQDTVNRNVQMNELAGAVDITSIANIPKGYDAYTSLALVDGKFYKPEEIYKNQTTTDNVRVLRGLTGGSDRLHQEMINQQFKLGK